MECGKEAAKVATRELSKAERRVDELERAAYEVDHIITDEASSDQGCCWYSVEEKQRSF